MYDWLHTDDIKWNIILSAERMQCEQLRIVRCEWHMREMQHLHDNERKLMYQHMSHYPMFIMRPGKLVLSRV